MICTNDSLLNTSPLLEKQSFVWWKRLDVCSLHNCVSQWMTVTAEDILFSDSIAMALKSNFLWIETKLNVFTVKQTLYSLKCMWSTVWVNGFEKRPEMWTFSFCAHSYDMDEWSMNTISFQSLDLKSCETFLSWDQYWEHWRHEKYICNSCLKSRSYSSISSVFE